MQKLDSIVMFRGQLEAIMELTSLKDVKSVVAAVIEYGMNGQSVEMPEHLRFGWKCIQSQIDQSKEYLQSSMNPELNKNNIKIKNNNLYNLKNNFNIKKQEENLKEEKENIIKEKKKTEAASGTDTETSSEINPPDNFKKWTYEMFCESVDSVIAKAPEYSCFRDDFIRYWTEPDPNGKMRFTFNQTWRTAGRLATWAKNNPAVWNNGSNNNNSNSNSEGSFGRYVPRNG